MPWWGILLIVLGVISIIGCSIAIPIIVYQKKFKNKPVKAILEKNYFNIEHVVGNTVKITVKFWKVHETRAQLRIALKKTYKGTIEDCLSEFFSDLNSISLQLSNRENISAQATIKDAFLIYCNEYKIVSQILKWNDEYSSIQDQKYNFYQFIQLKIESYILDQNKSNIEQINKNNGFIGLKKFINSYRNSRNKELLNPGIYVIWNKTKNLYYVGQAYNMHKRVATGHFDVKGNCKNVLFYEDYKAGDEFFVCFMPCERSELNNREKDTIKLYYPNVYNKTKGNI